MVEDLDGNAIGPDPHDRIDLALLPGDADANRTVDTADYTRIDDVLTATYMPADNSLHDQNRDSSITTADKTREQALLNGPNCILLNSYCKLKMDNSPTGAIRRRGRRNRRGRPTWRSRGPSPGPASP